MLAEFLATHHDELSVVSQRLRRGPEPIEDECGGLTKGRADDHFRPFEQRGGDRGDLGLGLSTSRRAVEVNGGKIGVRNLPRKGCVFAIDFAPAWRLSSSAASRRRPSCAEVAWSPCLSRKAKTRK